MSSAVVKGDMALRLLVHLGQIAGAAVVSRQDDLCAMVPRLDTCGGVLLQMLFAGSGTA